jgi:PAS domain S-box-containing protein
MIDWNRIPNASANQNFLANHSTHAIVVIDRDGRILMANPAAGELLGYDSFEGLNIRDIAPPPYTQLFKPEFTARGYGSVVRQFLLADGRLKWMTAQGIVLKDEKDALWGYFIYMYDSTTERELRAEIEHLSSKMRGVVDSIQHVLNKQEALPPGVTPAEREIAALVKKGLSSREIADHRGIGVKSVENARVALRRKLGLDRRSSLRVALQAYGDL